MNTLRVVEPGALASVQDLGRSGWASSGVPKGGAADVLSLRIGNRLIGNGDGEAAIELTMSGGRFLFEEPALVCIAGAALPEAFMRRGEATRTLGSWTPTLVDGGCELNLGVMRGGARSYLCIAGGVRTQMQLGSRSTLIVGGKSILGRVLRGGESITIGRLTPGLRVGSLDSHARKTTTAGIGRRTIRVVPAGREESFGEDDRRRLADEPWRVSPQSNRSGLRLESDGKSLQGGRQIRSRPVVPGSIQVPPDGQPIVLGVDGPVTGGYPVIACAIEADQPALGQIRPGEAVRFQWVEREEAWTLFRDQERLIARVRTGRAELPIEHHDE